MRPFLTISGKKEISKKLLIINIITFFGCKINDLEYLAAFKGVYFSYYAKSGKNISQ